MTITGIFDKPMTKGEFSGILLDRACDAVRIMHGKWPGDRAKQADYMLLTLDRAFVLVNLVKEDGRDEPRLFYVKGVNRAFTVPQSYFMAYISDEWTHSAWRLAYGDDEPDVYFRKQFEENDPDAVDRLTQWLTPAGMAQRANLKGDYSEYPDLAAVQRYHDLLIEHSDVEACDLDVEVSF